MMRISAPWSGCPLEFFTMPLSVATASAFADGEINQQTEITATKLASVFMSARILLSRTLVNALGLGMVPAEGLEPTRSCDHWILSPARLPFRHAGYTR